MQEIDLKSTNFIRILQDALDSRENLNYLVNRLNEIQSIDDLDSKEIESSILLQTFPDASLEELRRIVNEFHRTAGFIESTSNLVKSNS